IGERTVGPGTVVFHADPHYEEDLSTETGGLMFFVQDTRPETGKGPIYDGPFNMAEGEPLSPEEPRVYEHGGGLRPPSEASPGDRLRGQRPRSKRNAQTGDWSRLGFPRRAASTRAMVVGGLAASRLISVASVAGAALALSGVAIYNGFPLVWYDTSSHLASALRGEQFWARTNSYSLFLAALHQGGWLWPPIFAQS